MHRGRKNDLKNPRKVKKEEAKGRKKRKKGIALLCVTSHLCRRANRRPKSNLSPAEEGGERKNKKKTNSPSEQKRNKNLISPQLCHRAATVKTLRRRVRRRTPNRPSPPGQKHRPLPKDGFIRRNAAMVSQTPTTADRRIYPPEHKPPHPRSPRPSRLSRPPTHGN